MNYRVKQTILRNGSSYVPQRKVWFFWVDIEEKLSYDNIHDAIKYIEYYDLVYTKKNIKYISVDVNKE